MDRPPELMSDAELVRALDQADADLARIETRRLRIVAAMDKSGYAEQAGARDMVQYLEFRYRLDHSRAYREPAWPAPCRSMRRSPPPSPTPNSRTTERFLRWCCGRRRPRRS
ncbi:hypothetical protein [Kribbella soli]|uniref:hypothetical protein n=1 Tax=Kribbella soli TaxID=1124743 RepID=UPI0013F47FFB|nr:hypothetical protein [Kribbella soli]